MCRAVSECGYVLGLYSRIFNVCLILVSIGICSIVANLVIIFYFPSFINSVGIVFALIEAIVGCMGLGFIILCYRIRKDYLEKAGLR